MTQELWSKLAQFSLNVPAVRNSHLSLNFKHFYKITCSKIEIYVITGQAIRNTFASMSIGFFFAPLNMSNESGL